MICDLRTIHYCISASDTLDLFQSVFMARDSLPCQLDVASAVTTVLELDTCHKVAVPRTAYAEPTSNYKCTI